MSEVNHEPNVTVSVSELTRLVNFYGIEKESGTPDYILAEFLSGVHKALDKKYDSDNISDFQKGVMGAVSIEGGATPLMDSGFLVEILNLFNKAVQDRARWRGEEVKMHFLDIV